MRNSQAKKDENRHLILEAAGRLFRERGINGVSVAEVMSAANMTHGGFYRHFADKNELVTETLSLIYGDEIERAKPIAEQNIAAFANDYLSLEHRKQIGSGCAIAALGPEIVRGESAPRQVMNDAIRRQFDSFAQGSSLEDGPQQRQAAIGSFATMVGALVLSRLADDPLLAEEILEQAKNWLSSRVPGSSQNNALATD